MLKLQLGVGKVPQCEHFAYTVRPALGWLGQKELSNSEPSLVYVMRHRPVGAIDDFVSKK